MANVPITSLPVASAPAMDDYLILQGASTRRIKWSTLLDKLWPVGSIYQSSSSTSPASFLGGTWERIKDRFLLAAGDTYAAGSTGGEAAHALTVQEIAKHKHIVRMSGYTNWPQETINGYILKFDPNVIDNIGSGLATLPHVANADINIQNTGENAAHNNMPPYKVFYFWQRIE